LAHGSGGSSPRSGASIIWASGEGSPNHSRITCWGELERRERKRREGVRGREREREKKRGGRGRERERERERLLILVGVLAQSLKNLFLGPAS
jgi:hypothetical protein